MDEEPENLSELLTRLPPATPLFMPDELLGIMFSHGRTSGTVDQDALDSAREFGEQFGCTFTYDENMGEWCFTKPPTTN